VHSLSVVMQSEIHTAELLMRDPSILNLKLKKYTSSHRYEIPAELIQAEVNNYGLRFVNS
jgi:hypothetical protein